MKFKLFILTISIFLFYLIKKQSIVKQVYARNRAIPNYYSEMKSIVEEFRESEKSEIPWDNLVELGDMYARGLYPYITPDEKTALLCYDIACRCPDKKTAGYGRAKVLENVNNPVSKSDRLGQKVDTKYATQISRHALNKKIIINEIELDQKISENRSSENNGRETYQSTEIERRNSKRRKETNVHNTTRVPSRIATQRRRNITDRLGGGSQNTHDHGVTSATKNNIRNMKEEFLKSGEKFRNNEDVIKEAVGICQKVRDNPMTADMTSDDLVNAHHVAVSLSPDEYSGTGVSQIEILDIVLWKIRTIQDEIVRGNVKETLCKRLATGFEQGSVVCGTGKVSRIVSVFEGVLDTQKSVSIDVIEKEIGQLAAKIRSDFLDSIGPVGRKAYESDNSVPEYSVAMASRLRNKVREEYIDKLNLIHSVVNPLVDVYADAF